MRPGDSDENSWPPSYHGTGSEEYFNSGWCQFDRKAVSGFVKVHPGDVIQVRDGSRDAEPGHTAASGAPPARCA